MNSHSRIQTVRPALLLLALMAIMGAAYGQVSATGAASKGGESWPQRFELSGAEPMSFGFAATQPGEIQVEVQAQGAPIRVALLGPTRQESVGTGHIVLRYSLTAADAARGALWYVRVSLQNAPSVAGQPLAGGSISVQHPAADAALVQQDMDARIAQHRATKQQLPAKMAADIQGKMRDRQTQLAKYHDDQRAASQSHLPPAVLQAHLATRGLPMGQPLRAPTAQALAPIRSPLPVMPQPVPTLPPPVITRVSDGQGLPRQLITIEGTGFGTQPGAVEFLITPAGSKGYGPVQGWSDTLIAVHVPDASGVLNFPAGALTVLRASDAHRSNTVPFGFVAEVESRYVTQTNARQLGDFVIAAPGKLESDMVDHGPETTGNIFLGAFYGAKGDDVLLPNSRLVNNWQVDWVQLYTADSGGAWNAGDRRGTDLPFLQVHWYYDAFGDITYGFNEQITGPRGTPDGVILNGPLNPIIP